MPTVPAYESRVAPQGLPSARQRVQLDPDAYGQGVAKGLQEVGDQLSKIQVEEKAKRDTAAVMEGDQWAAQAEFELFHDPKNGVFAKRGKDAIGASDKALPEWDKRVAEYASKLQSDDQRQAFTKLMQNRRQDLQRQGARHTVEESRRYYGDLSKSYVGTAQQSAVANYTDLERVDGEVKKARNAILLDVDGKSAEQIKIEQDEAEGSVHAAVVGRMLEDSALKANEYFLKIRERLPADVSLRLANALETGVAQETGAAKADEILRRAPSKSAALSMINEIEDPKVKAAAKSEVTARFAEIAAAKTEATDAAKDAGWQLAVSGVPLSQMPKHVVGALFTHSPETIKEIMKWEERDGKAKTDHGAYYELTQMPPDKFRSINLMDYRNRLDDADFEKFANDQKTLRNGGANAGFGADELNRQFDSTARSILFPNMGDTAKLTEGGKRQLGVLRTRVDRAIEQAKAEGIKLDFDTRQKIIDRESLQMWREMEKVEADYGWTSLGVDKPISQITVEDVERGGAVIPIKRLPAGEIELAKQHLTGINAEASDKNVSRYISLFNAYANGGMPPGQAKQAALSAMRVYIKGD